MYPVHDTPQSQPHCQAQGALTYGYACLPEHASAVRAAQSAEFQPSDAAGLPPESVALVCAGRKIGAMTGRPTGVADAPVGKPVDAPLGDGVGWLSGLGT